MPSSEWILAAAKCLEPEEVQAVVDAARGRAERSRKRGGLQAETSYLALRLGLETGLRATEMATLGVADVDLRKLATARLLVRCGKGGKPLNRHSLNGRMLTIYRQAGLPQERIEQLSPVHSLRHTCGTALYRATRDLRLVQEHLGHSRSTTTEVYAKVLDRDKRAAVEAAFAPYDDNAQD